jgi:hypothetical protein
MNLGHTGGTRFGQTWKKPKDLSTLEGEECGSVRGGVYVVYKCERVTLGQRGGCGLGESSDHFQKSFMWVCCLI